MSYDVYLEIDTGGDELVEVYDRNYTSNVSRMWRTAGVNLRELTGMVAADAVPLLDRAIGAMTAEADTYRAMNPPNGWGDYDGALTFLCDLRAACVKHPKTTLRVSA